MFDSVSGKAEPRTYNLTVVMAIGVLGFALAAGGALVFFAPELSPMGMRMFGKLAVLGVLGLIGLASRVVD